MDVEKVSSSAIAEEFAQPRGKFVDQLKARTDLKQTGFVIDFPLFFNDPDVSALYAKVAIRKGQVFGVGIHNIYFWNQSQQKLEGAVHFTLQCEGPGGSVHGGAIATALDSALGWAVIRIKGFGCVTLNLNVNYRKFIKLGSSVRLEVQIEKVESKKIYLKGQLINAENPSIIHADATALFYQTVGSMDFDSTYKLFGSESGLTKERAIDILQKDLEKRKEKKHNAKAQQKAKL